MKAIRVHQFGDPDVLKLQEIPAPRPGAGQILVRVEAAGVNPVETYIRAGKYGPRQFPFTPGDDCAGTVETIGGDVKGFKIGDRVYTDRSVSGTYAQLALFEPQFVHPLPQEMSFVQGAGVGIPCGTAYRGLFQRGRAKAGETVLIHGGSGAVGTAAIQLARAAGMTVIASASSREGKNHVLEQGAHHAVDHAITENRKEVDALTGGKGLDLIIELASHKNLASDLTAVARHGRIVVIGSRGKIEIDPRDAMIREAEIFGLALPSADAAEHREIFSGVTAALFSGVLRPVIGLELTLEQAGEAHRQVIEGEHLGKIVLLPGK